jgi:hypothetical protein
MLSDELGLFARFGASDHLLLHQQHGADVLQQLFAQHSGAPFLAQGCGERFYPVKASRVS